MTNEQLSGPLSLIQAGENELVAVRVIDAPRERVFEAWTNPELLAQWWGPRGFTNTFSSFDARPGGEWTFMMHGPNGADYPNKNVFEEIASPERIVLKHVEAPVFRLTALFEDLDGKTGMIFRQQFEEANVFEQVKGYAAKGNEENLEKLAEAVAKLASESYMCDE